MNNYMPAFSIRTRQATYKWLGMHTEKHVSLNLQKQQITQNYISDIVCPGETDQR